LGDLAPALNFGVAEESAYLLDYVPASGLLGLTPNRSTISPLTQILSKADKNVFTMWNSARNEGGNGTGMLTFGAEDSVNCPSAYVYANQLDPNEWLFNAESLSSGSLSVSIKNATFDEWESGLVVRTNEQFYFIGNATGATLTEDGYLIVECKKAAQLPTIQFNLGGDQSLPINMANFVYDGSGECTLKVYRYSYRGAPDLTLGFEFVENRCIAVDLDKNQIGFSSSA